MDITVITYLIIRAKVRLFLIRIDIKGFISSPPNSNILREKIVSNIAKTIISPKRKRYFPSYLST
jgi:hypothetical protein